MASLKLVPVPRARNLAAYIKDRNAWELEEPRVRERQIFGPNRRTEANVINQARPIKPRPNEKSLLSTADIQLDT